MLTQHKQYYVRIDQTLGGFGGLVLSMLASGTQDRGFEPGRSRRHAFLRRGSKARVADLRHVKEPCDLRGSRNRRPN
jgi:hypothetical protein